jgi:hypothetical protein
MNKLELKEIRQRMQIQGTKFKILDNRMVAHHIFTVGDGYISGGILTQMNIEYIGRTKMDLYTYSMLGKRINETILFKNVEIIK